MINADDVHWIVNDLGELGVEIQGQCFFLYKGYSLEYAQHADEREIESGVMWHPDGTPMKYRSVGKREFGETCWPIAWVLDGKRQDRYNVDLAFIPGLSDGVPEDTAWKPLPSKGSSTCQS